MTIMLDRERAFIAFLLMFVFLLEHFLIVPSAPHYCLDKGDVESAEGRMEYHL